jgi:large subunit ribosomal protein L21
MHAVIETGGKQYRVAPGDTIRVEKLPGAVGSEIEFDKVVAVFAEADSILSRAEAGAVRVKATITAQDRSGKVLAFKFKRKKQVRRTIGHRQYYTSVKVNEINA